MSGSSGERSAVYESEGQPANCNRRDGDTRGDPLCLLQSCDETCGRCSQPRAGGHSTPARGGRQTGRAAEGRRTRAGYHEALAATWLPLRRSLTAIVQLSAYSVIDSPAHLLEL